jgi:hypothetical protein
MDLSLRHRLFLALALAAAPGPGCGGGAAVGGAGGTTVSSGSGGAPDRPDASVEGPDLFLAGEILGRPTASSVALNVVPAVDLDAYAEVGPAPGTYPEKTPPALRPAGQPFVITLEGLSPDTAYTYRLRFRRPGKASFAAGPERAFHTQRPAGATFRFTVQADSHLDENSDLDVYHRTLANVLADAPDFHLDLGDTFMCEKHAEPLTATVQAAPDEATVVQRYVYERGHFGLVAHSAPLFLVNGNHDGELGWLFTGTGNDLATWTSHARERYYLNPTPDGFYSGDAAVDPVVGQRASWYAWSWGDALFVALDPFWYNPHKPGADAWGWTLGKAQYGWLVTTLNASQARFKLVFLHNLVGGLDGQMRGGVEAAPFFEWGGQNPDGTPGFAQHRPGWGKPIHQVLVDAKVSAVFHGHDHLYAHQTLDGVVYQEVPQPSAKNTGNGAMLAQSYHYADGTILSSAGHLRVTVTPAGITGEYVRAWLPASESASQRNGEIAHAWTIP